MAITHKLGEETLYGSLGDLRATAACIRPRDWVGHLHRNEPNDEEKDSDSFNFKYHNMVASWHPNMCSLGGGRVGLGRCHATRPRSTYGVHFVVRVVCMSRWEATGESCYNNQMKDEGLKRGLRERKEDICVEHIRTTQNTQEVNNVNNQTKDEGLETRVKKRKEDIFVLRKYTLQKKSEGPLFHRRVKEKVLNWTFSIVNIISLTCLWKSGP